MSRPLSPPPKRASNSTGRVLTAVAALAPLVALMWVSSYAKSRPELWGLPFFYWYQLLWVLITAGLTFLAYVVVRRHDIDRARERPARDDADPRR